MDETRPDVLKLIETAHDLVCALCKPRNSHGAREWMMSIPARPDYDPDLVIGGALMAAAGEIKQLRIDVTREIREAQEARRNIVTLTERLATAREEAWAAACRAECNLCSQGETAERDEDMWWHDANECDAWKLREARRKGAGNG